jgi:hypothetical protein
MFSGFADEGATAVDLKNFCVPAAVVLKDFCVPAAVVLKDFCVHTDVVLKVVRVSDFGSLRVLKNFGCLQVLLDFQFAVFGEFLDLIQRSLVCDMIPFLETLEGILCKKEASTNYRVI